jgi:hypothetical protein
LWRWRGQQARRVPGLARGLQQGSLGPPPLTAARLPRRPPDLSRQAAPPDLLSRRHLQLLQERCELLALLARLYELHSSGAAAAASAGDKENAAAGKGDKAGGGEDLFSPDRFSSLLQALHRAVLHPRQARAAGEGGPAGELARLSESLVSALRGRMVGWGGGVVVARVGMARGPGRSCSGAAARPPRASARPSAQPSQPPTPVSPPRPRC